MSDFSLVGPDQAVFGAGKPACVREFTPSMPVVFRGVLIKEKHPLSENAESGPVPTGNTRCTTTTKMSSIVQNICCVNMFYFNQNPWEQLICWLTIDFWFNEREADWTSIYIPYKCCSLKKFLEHLSFSRQNWHPCSAKPSWGEPFSSLALLNPVHLGKCLSSGHAPHLKCTFNEKKHQKRSNHWTNDKTLFSQKGTFTQANVFLSH